MSKELAPTKSEGYVETPRESHERSRERADHHQQSPERYNENQAHQEAENLQREQTREKRAHQAQRHNSSHSMGREDREASFDQTMEHTRTELPRTLRPLSRFIHHPTVERVSEFLGRTVFRPNAILAGGVTAFIGVLGLYFYAKYAGFALQGSETIVAFGIGWVLGMLFDLFKSMFTSKS